MSDTGVVKTKETWEIGGRKILAYFYSEMGSKKFIEARKRIRDKNDFCPICKTMIRKDDLLATTISCHSGWLPNLVCHQECLVDTGEDGLPALAEEYEQYKKAKLSWG